MHISHETKLGKGLSTTHYDNFPTVELHDDEGTMYIPQQCWKKLIKVLERLKLLMKHMKPLKIIKRELDGVKTVMRFFDMVKS